MNESILSKTLGLTYEDPFFYFTVVFLIWFLFFCTNAVAVSILMNFIVIKIKQNDIINYNPTKIMSRDSISIILKFCNTTVFYGCCALLFLPLGIYCIINNIEPFWVIRMLFTYSFFVISTLTLPKFIFYSYIKHKTNRYLIHERAKFYEGILDANHSLYNNATALAEQIYLANRYWFLQEIKANYASPVGLDSSSVVTYISAILSFLTAILSEVIKLALNKPLT
jgi:hypothetical protein